MSPGIPAAPVSRSSPPPTLAEYAKHVAKRAEVLWVDDVPWVLRDRILRPLSPPHRLKPISRRSIRAAMKQAGAVLAQWTEGWDTPACDWWYVCCDQKDYDLGTLKKDPRYEVRKGLEQCEVRPVDPSWFAENGYRVYAAAFRRYGTPPVLTESGFVKEFLTTPSTRAAKPGELSSMGSWSPGRAVS